MDDKNETYEIFIKEFMVLRQKLISVFILFFAGSAIGLLFNQQILKLALKIFNFSGVNMVLTSPGQMIEISIYTAVLTGLFFATPVLIYQIYMYIRPAFKDKEYHLIMSFVPLSLVLFILGGAFGVWINQLMLALFSKFSSDFRLNNIWDLQRFFSQVIMTAILTGLLFQMPLFLSALIRFRLLSRQLLVQKRKVAYVILLIIAVLLPPTDILSLLILTIPLILLYELTLFLNVGQP